MNNIHPPKWVDHLLEWYCNDEYIDEVIGDLHEFFYERLRQRNAIIARFMYLFDAIRSINELNMKKDYVEYSSSRSLNLMNASFNGFRNLKKRKFITGINLLGFTIGLTCFILFFNFYENESHFDDFHKRGDQIYRITQTGISEGQTYGLALTPFPLGPTLQNDYPEVIQTRLYQTFRKVPFLSLGEGKEAFYEDKLFFTDSSFFDIFTYDLIQGNPTEALKNPGSIVITERLSQKYFGNADPMNQLIWLEGKMPFTVTGVAKNPSDKAHFTFNALAALQNIEDIFRATGNTFPHNGWYWTAVHTYMLMPEDIDESVFRGLLTELKDRHLPENYTHVAGYDIQRLGDIHLGSDLNGEIQPNRKGSDLRLYLIAGVVILLIASINFINVSTSQSTERLKELSVKRIFGASKWQLIAQIMLESGMLVLFAFICSMALSIVLLPYFNQLLETNLLVGDLFTFKACLIYLASVLTIILLAGIYPALHAVALVNIMGPRLGVLARGKFKSPLVRKSLVVLQFTISSLMIFFTLIINNQYSLLINKELKFDMEEVFMIPIKGSSVKDNITAFKQRLLQSPRFLGASTVSDVVGEKTVFGRFTIGDDTEDTPMNMLSVDFDFLKTFDIKLKEGRNYDPEIHSDSNAFLINEDAVRLFENGNWQELGIEDRPVIGVIDDFHFASLFHKMGPLLIRINDDWANFLAVKMAPGDLVASANELAALWSEFDKVQPFDGFYLEEAIQRSYEDESQLRSLLSTFSSIAMLLAILGLFALVNYTVKFRIKEIGIRKVLGASYRDVLNLIFREFDVLFGLACLLSFSIGVYLAREWLMQFPYRIELNAKPFLLTTGILVAITAITIFLSSRRAVLVNPVETLAEE